MPTQLAAVLLLSLLLLRLVVWILLYGAAQSAWLGCVDERVHVRYEAHVRRVRVHLAAVMTACGQRTTRVFSRSDGCTQDQAVVEFAPYANIQIDLVTRQYLDKGCDLCDWHSSIQIVSLAQPGHATLST
eukprot:6885519-Prymnesium_polylepis.1